jgi:hypothetical protein
MKIDQSFLLVHVDDAVVGKADSGDVTCKYRRHVITMIFKGG